MRDIFSIFPVLPLLAAPLCPDLGPWPYFSVLKRLHFKVRLLSFLTAKVVFLLLMILSKCHSFLLSGELQK